MSKTIVVLISWIVTKPTLMIALAGNLIKLMTLNVVTFPTPDVLLTNVETAQKRLQAAYNARMNGDAAKIEFNEACVIMNEILHSLANYVNGVSKGNAATIALSGFKPTSNNRIKKQIPVTSGVAGLKTPGGGLLKIVIPKIIDATNYIVVVFLDTVSDIIIGANFVRTATDSIIIAKAKERESIVGLPIGSIVTVVLLAQNAAGIGPVGPSVKQLIN